MAIIESTRAIVLLDQQGLVQASSRGFLASARHVGASIGTSILDHWDASYISPSLLRTMAGAARRGDAWCGPIYNIGADRALYWGKLSLRPVGQVGSGGVLAVFDAFDEKAAPDLIDVATRLPNRSGVEIMLGDLVDESSEDAKYVLVQIKVDNLKIINGSYGYAAGDAVLIEAARRLFTSVRNLVVLGRTGSSEFLAVIAARVAGEGVREALRRVQESFQAPFRIADTDETLVPVTLSTSVYPDDGDKPARLLQNCDLAMARARSTHLGHQRYLPEMRRSAAAQLDLQRRLRNALQANEFRLAYQPLADAKTGKMVGSEALLRWDEPGKGMVSPGVFIPAAEEGALIVSMSGWVLHTACHQAMAWLKSGLSTGSISVNISARHFYAGTLINDVQAALGRSGLPADRLTIEITENVVLEENPQVIDTLNELARMGIRLSLDDFGTGYSSLSYLRKFPFQSLKIDQSFVRDMTKGRRHRALVRGIIEMAKSLDLEVIAEGVESPDQLTILQEDGCHFIQGYHFSKPLAPAEIIHFVGQPQ